MKQTRLISTFLAAALMLAAMAPGRTGAEPAKAGGMQQFTLNDPPLPVPETRFLDAAGKEVTLADFKGRALLVNFWATWCGPCVEEMPSLDRLQAALGGKDFTVLTINEDRRGAAVAGPFLEKHGLKHLGIHADRRMALAHAFGLQGMPSSYLIDRHGKLIGSLIGPAEWDSPAAKALIRRYLAPSRTDSSL
jgi:thiol-disulfide isomerase/thioredoxin